MGQVMKREVVALLLLSACAAADNRVFHRLDGRPIRSDPVILQQHTVDEKLCLGEGAKADAASNAPAIRRQRAYGDIIEGCMAQRGYVLGPRD